jgi:hypothetical protein
MRDQRRLNALARGRLRAQRSAAPRFDAEPEGRDDRCAAGTDVSQVSSAEILARQRLVAILGPVIGCRRLAEPRATAGLLWAIPEC